MEDLRIHKTINIGETIINICDNHFPKDEETQQYRLGQMNKVISEILAK